MPTYVYKCGECGRRQEAIRTIAERHDAPKCAACYGPTALRITATMVSVFQPYRTAAVDKDAGKRISIRNKAEHEAFLRRNGYEEVGNDPSMKPVTHEEDAERRQRWADAAEAPMVDVDKLKREGFVQEDLTA